MRFHVNYVNVQEKNYIDFNPNVALKKYTYSKM